MILEQIAPDIAALYDVENTVVVIGPTICGDCGMTIKLITKKKGIAAAKHVINDRMHPVFVALRAHLGLDPDAPVSTPVVFVKGKFGWNGGVNGFEISRLTTEPVLV